MLAVGNKTNRKPLVYFVGLSAKPNCEHLDLETRTGYIIEQITYYLPSVKIVKTNLVKTPPMDQAGKLRYPNPDEMQLGWNELQDEMNLRLPTLLVTLGQQVSFFLRSKMGVQPAKPQLPPDFSYQPYLSQSQSNILSVHHPSFVYVYRRKYIENYVESVALSILTLVSTVAGENERTEPKRSVSTTGQDRK